MFTAADLIKMPRKNKLMKKPKDKGKKILARHLSIHDEEQKKKKDKKDLKRATHSSSEIYQLQNQSSTEDDYRSTPPPPQNNRPTSPLNFFLPILEYGFSWPRRKSPFKNSGESKNIRSPILSSPDSGVPNSPVCDDILLSPTRDDVELCVSSRPRAMSPIAAFREKNPSPLSIVPEHGSQSSLEDKGNSSPNEDVDAVMLVLDDAINFDFGNESESRSCDKTSGSSDDSEISAINEANSQNDDSLRDGLNGIMIKDGKSSVSKRVRFSLENRSLRKSKSCEIIRNISEPCVFAVTVKVVEIAPSTENEGESTCKEINSFQALVCHHPDCTEANDGHPLLMCRECDQGIHGNPGYSSHLVLDASKKRTAVSLIGRGDSTPNLKGHDDGNTSDTEVKGHGDDPGEDMVDGIYMRKAEVSDFRPPPVPTATELKLKRKKVVKLKRRHTDGSQSGNELYTDDSDDNDHNIQRRKSDDLHSGSPAQRLIRRHSKSVISDECFTVRFIDKEDNDMEIVAAIKGVSLRAALMPLLDRRGLDMSRINVFVEASNTPLPLECESFLLGGNTLNIKEKETDLAFSKNNSRPNSGSKTSGNKNAKSSGMGRRESFFGRAPPPVEVLPVKQRRNSLSIPFFSTNAPKSGDGSRLLDDNQSVGSLRSRRGINLSIDDTTPIPAVLSSVSPQGTITGYTEGRRVKDRSKLTNLFSPMGSKDKEKHEQLSELLNTYSNSGLPPMPDLLNIGRRQVDESMFDIEPHWSSLVDNASTLTKRQHDQQEAIWELLNTEVQYLKSLRVITDLFMCCLINLQGESLLNEIDTEQLFCNINDIVNVNCEFWESHLLKVLRDARESREPLNPSDMKEGFKKFPELFSPYTKYCIEQKPCTEYMKAKYADNDLFKTFVVWAETQKQCNRLKLTDLLVKPMQRLTKYSLLLQAILRKTESERQRRDLLEMIGGVDKFVSHVNATLRQKHDQERLTQIMAKIESYDAVECPNDESVRILQEYNNNFDLLLPMPGCGPDQTRSLIMQSVLKMKDSTSRIDVECLLFTDLLLICKSSKRMEKYKIIKPPMRVDRIIVQELKDKGSFLLIYLNEYHVPVTAFTFHADQSSVKIWMEHIRKAQELYREVKDSSHSESGYSYLSKGEVVEEEVIRTTPLHTLVENTTDTLLSPTSHEITAPDFSRSPVRSPVSPEVHPIHKSNSDFVIDASHQGENNSRSTNSVELSSPSSHRVVQCSYSVPNFHDNSGDDEEKNKVNSSSNVSSANSDSSLPDIIDDSLRQKLNQRRSSRSEKRYYTADAIQELSKTEEKDSSIYKRLSWNFGTKEQNDERQSLLRNKVQSTDSIRSIHSSSGVSSTGSLHLSPDGDIFEEIEVESNNNDTDSTLQDSQYLDVDDSFDINEKDRHKSKSTTDISKLFQDLTTSDVKDGISSVDIPSDLDKKKLTHAQIMRMKKRLLLSSNVEASEV